MSLRTFGRKLFLVGSVFLVAQALIYLYLAFINNGKNVRRMPRVHEVKWHEGEAALNGLRVSVSENFLEEADTFARFLREKDCFPFIISPRILTHIWNVKRNITDCVGDGYKCMLDGDDIFFGLDQSCLMKIPWEQIPAELMDIGFNISLTKTSKYIGIPPKEECLTTSLILKGTHSFMVVLLQSREDNFWWHGSIYDDGKAMKELEAANLFPSNLAFMHRQGAIPKFDLIETKLLKYSFMVPKDIPAFLKATSGSASDFVECDYNAAHSFYNTHGRDQSVTAVRFRHQAWKLLSRAKRILDDLEVPFWLSSGTCLGYLRQCEFIPYSQDVDLGVFASDYKEELMPAFISHGFKLHHTFGKLNDSYQIAFQYGKIKLDIFFFYVDKETGTMWNGGTEARSGRKFKYTFPAFSLCWTEFLDLLVRVPCNTTKYIEANYGSEWATPVTSWSWKSSPPNVQVNGVWPKEEWSKVINLHSS